MANPSIRFRKVQSYPTSGVNVGDVIFCIEDRTVYVATGSTTKEAFYGGNVKNVTKIEDSNGNLTGLTITYMDGTDTLTVDFSSLARINDMAETISSLQLNKVSNVTGVNAIGASTMQTGGTSTAVVVLKLDSSGNVALSQSASGLKASVDLSGVASYTIEALSTAEDNNLKSYQLMKDGVAVGDKINIPKDFLVKTGSVMTGTWDGDTFTPDSSGTGKALALALATKDGSSYGSTVYINVKDLVDVYTAGDGISVGSDNKVSLDGNNAASYIMVPDPESDAGDTDLNTAIEVIREQAMGDRVKSINGKTGYVVLKGYAEVDEYKRVTFIGNTDGSIGAYVPGLGTAAAESADNLATKEYVDNKHTWYSF